MAPEMNSMASTGSNASQDNLNDFPEGQYPSTAIMDPTLIMLSGSVNLKSQMLARAAHNYQSARLPLQVGQLRQNQDQVDPDILSRMVTASGTRINNMPIRVASMQNFRRSVKSLNPVLEPPMHTQLEAPNKTFTPQLQEHRRSTLEPSHRRLSSDNPLLKMMEQRMAAKKAIAGKIEETLPSARSSAPPPFFAMGDDSRAALQASIEKWSGIGNPALVEKDEPTSKVREAIKPVFKQPTIALPQSYINETLSGRVPLTLNPPQIGSLQELTSSQNHKGDELISQEEMLQKLLLRQASGMGHISSHHAHQANDVGKASMTNLRQAPQPVGSYVPGLTRCAVSFAEVDRLRRENQYIQLMREQVTHKRLKEQAYLHHRDIAASALMSMQQNGGQTQTQETFNQIQVNASKLNQQRSSTEMSSICGGLKSAKTLSSSRKRRSLRHDEDESICSKSSRSTHTHSVTSSASSHHMIYPSPRYGIAPAALSGSMENLRIKSQLNLLGDSKRNESFSSGPNATHHNYLTSSGLNRMNQSFSLNSSASIPNVTQATLKRSTSSVNWIPSLISEQKSAGDAAATFVAVKNSTKNLKSLLHHLPPSSSKETEEVSSTDTPIQVQAEEYGPPPTSSEATVIISRVPDSIKYLNSKANSKPIDIVKEALSSRGANCETKSSMDMEDGFFIKMGKMYDQETMNAIRSNDVESLRQMSANGTSLQCGNQFGETLIHLACRRSNLDLVSFLVNEVGVSLRVRDDFGRTPWHDACWRTEPDLGLLDVLLDQEPELLMLSDKRGHTPLDYARREHWAVLVPFLLERRDKFRPV